MLIKNIDIINLSQLKVFNNKDIIIENGRITNIVETAGTTSTPTRENEEVIDGSIFYALPGLINTHSHVAMTLLRGAVEDVTPEVWFNEGIWKLEANLEPDDVYWGTLLGACEMLLNGVTTVTDHYFFMEKAFQAYDEIGMRADLAYAIFGLGENWESKFKQAMKFNESYVGLNTRLNISLGPHSPYTCPEDFLRRVADISKQTGLKSHIHVSETKKEVAISLNRNGKTPVEVIREMGILREGTILAHALYATDEDFKLIKTMGGGIAHCPKTYMKFGDSNNFLERAIRGGVKVGLGTDGTTSGNSLSIIEAARMGALMGKVVARNPEIIKIEEVLPLMAVKGANVLGLSDLGEIQEGFKADIILIKKNSPSLIPEDHLFAHILYSIQEGDVDSVIVNGELVVKNRKILSVDLDEIKKEVDERNRRLHRLKGSKKLQDYHSN